MLVIILPIITYYCICIIIFCSSGYETEYEDNVEDEEAVEEDNIRICKNDFTPKH